MGSGIDALSVHHFGSNVRKKKKDTVYCAYAGDFTDNSFRHSNNGRVKPRELFSCVSSARSSITFIFWTYLITLVDIAQRLLDDIINNKANNKPNT